MSCKSAGKKVGFVPTMGALHEGHLELVRTAGSDNEVVIVSIFVNPVQFNNKEDLEKYPRNLEEDTRKLSNTPCSAIFAPSVEEMYPEPDHTEFDFGGLDQVMEGTFRPGHFRGVGVIVKKLLDIVEPDYAYFGEKDFQQLAIIRHMVKALKMAVTIVACPIVREPDGLAMSSRNARLTGEERSVAPSIYLALRKAQENYSWFSPEGVAKMVIGEIEEDQRFRVEYASVVDADTLNSFDDWDDVQHAVICVAVYLGQVRLIDNIRLF